MGKYKHPTRLIENPEDLRALFFDGYLPYLEEQASKWTTKQFVGKDGREETITPKMPVTFKGFLAYARVELRNLEQGVQGDIREYFYNTTGYHEEFSTISREIRDYCNADLEIGGLLKLYDSSITARLAGLKEQTENTNKNIQVLNIDPFADE